MDNHEQDHEQSIVECIAAARPPAGSDESSLALAMIDEILTPDRADALAPPCCSDDAEHDWQSPLSIVGGLEDEPGVTVTADGFVAARDVCSTCGIYRLVQYTAADETSLTWIHRLLANRFARLCQYLGDVPAASLDHEARLAAVAADVGRAMLMDMPQLRMRVRAAQAEFDARRAER